jgi:hypothetical protein
VCLGCVAWTRSNRRGFRLYSRRAGSSAGRALGYEPRGRGFDPRPVHISAISVVTLELARNQRSEGYGSPGVLDLEEGPTSSSVLRGTERTPGFLLVPVRKRAYTVTMADEPSNGSAPDGHLTPFERFERLTKHLVSVPKAEVDAARKRAKRAAARKHPPATTS